MARNRDGRVDRDGFRTKRSRSWTTPARSRTILALGMACSRVTYDRDLTNSSGQSVEEIDLTAEDGVDDTGEFGDV